MTETPPRPIDIDQLPDLETEVLMAGAMTQVEVGGNACVAIGVIISTQGG